MRYVDRSGTCCRSRDCSFGIGLHFAAGARFGTCVFSPYNILVVSAKYTDSAAKVESVGSS